MEQKRDLAIVLRSVAYEERHRIVTALTEGHGQVSAMARNSIQSRRFGGCLEPFAASEWSFAEKPGAELLRLDEAKIRRPYEGIRKSFERLSLASVFNELMLKLAPKGVASPDLFRLHSNALAELDEAPISGTEADGQRDLALLNGYLAKLLQWSGNQPQLLRCLGCAISIEDVAIDQSLNCVVQDAGWVCTSCRQSETRHVRDRAATALEHALLRIRPRAVVDFQVSLALPIRQAAAVAQSTPEEKKELFGFLEALFAYHVPGFDEKPLKSLRFLGLESNLRPPPASPR